MMTVDTIDNGRPELAQELLDFILDYLHYDSEALKRCALASRSLLPTCQRHLFSTFRVSKSNISNVLDLFDPMQAYKGGGYKDPTLRTAIIGLLNDCTTDLILDIYRDGDSGIVTRSTHFPEFKAVQRIVFKGESLSSEINFPLFLERTWKSPVTRIRTVELDFRFMTGDGVIKSLYSLPTTVENVSLTAAAINNDHSSSAQEFREYIEGRIPPSGPKVHHFNGTMKIRLASSDEDFIAPILELGDLFKFGLKRINFHLDHPSSIEALASLVGACGHTLQFLNVVCLPPERRQRGARVESWDLSRNHALKMIRVWIPAASNPSWLRAAISSISSNAIPRVPLRIEIHISLPSSWMYLGEAQEDTARELDEIVASWIPVDTQLSYLMGLSPDLPSATSVPGGTMGGISLDVTVPGVPTGPGKGISALMFPLLSGTEGIIRLV